MHAEKEVYIAVTGDCYFSLGKLDEAIACFNKLIDMNPYSASYWLGLARCYFEQQIFDKAIEACDYAIVIDDEFADAYAVKGHAFFQLGNEESAIENYTQAEKFGALSSSFIDTFPQRIKLPKGKWKRIRF
ncbi:tetratricopeptide repeat protein [Bacteroides sp. KG121]|uniref:tetratricopeptide repeat protein n=1 Tax=Bacteroides sp. KG121 TaxID=3397826 RepID=UPI003D98182D